MKKIGYWDLADSERLYYTSVNDGLTGGLNTEDLYNRYVFADDGSPCGEL